MRAGWVIAAAVVGACSPRPAASGADGGLDAGSTDAGSSDAGLDAGVDAGMADCTTQLFAGPVNGLALADFDHDGRLELAAAMTGAVLLLRADGGVMRQLSATVPGALFAGDLDGDGWADLVALHGALATVWLGPAFAAPHDFDCGTGAVAVAAADFDLDGHVDLAVIDESASTVSVLLGAGDGGFAAPLAWPTGLSPAGLAIADFDHDGRPDVASADFDTMAVGVLLGGDGGFAPRVEYAGYAFPLGVVTIDFDRDGFEDLAAACSRAS